MHRIIPRFATINFDNCFLDVFESLEVVVINNEINGYLTLFIITVQKGITTSAHE